MDENAWFWYFNKNLEKYTLSIFCHRYIKVLHKFNKNLEKYTLSFFYGYIKILHKYQHDIDLKKKNCSFAL